MYLDNSLYELGKIKPHNQQAKPTMDTATDKETQNTSSKSAIFAEQSIVSETAYLLNEWLNTDEDEEGAFGENEGYGDRLLALLVSIADDDKNGEISDDEAEVVFIAQNAAFDFFVSKGVSEENAIALLEDFDNELAQNVRETILSNLPDGDDVVFDEMDDVLFSDAENEAVLDSTAETLLDSIARKEGLTLDAAYRKVFAIRNGKKLRINKRVSGVVKLTAKQKIAIKKAQRKAHSGVARMKRLKSFKLRRKMGM